MTIQTKQIILREALLIAVLVAILFSFGKIGYATLDLPFQAHDKSVPSYSVAAQDSSLIMFKNGLLFLFKQPPTHEEIRNAYQSQAKNSSVQVLYPSDSYRNFWVFKINPSFGFVGIEFDRLARWIFLLFYPMYLMARLGRWGFSVYKEIVAL